MERRSWIRLWFLAAAVAALLGCGDPAGPGAGVDASPGGDGGDDGSDDDGDDGGEDGGDGGDGDDGDDGGEDGGDDGGDGGGVPDAGGGSDGGEPDSGPTACSPATCDGCCDGDQCVDGSSASACGTGGAACAICGDGQLCSSESVCALDPASRWDILIESGELPPATLSGQPWDPFNGLPDGFVEIAAGGDVAGSTGVVPNSLTPVWDELALVDVTAGLLLGGVTVRVLDSDAPFLPNRFGECPAELDETAFGGGAIALVCPETEQQSGFTVRFRVVPR